MPDKHRQAATESNGKKKRRAPAAIAEFVQLLERLRPEQTAQRLQFDMARDAGLEGVKQLVGQNAKLQMRLTRAKRRRHVVQSRLTGILNDLAMGPVRLPRPVGLPAVDQEQLEHTYRELGSTDYPALAEKLHAAIGQSDILAFQRFLVDEALLRGTVLLAEHLLRFKGELRLAEKELAFLDELRHHLVVTFGKKLAERTNYLVTPELGQEIDALMGKTLRFLVDLLTSDPVARLIVPSLGSDFDPEKHEAISGRPTEGSLHVRATMFPGLIVFAETPRVVAKARVYTKRAASDNAVPSVAS